MNKRNKTLSNTQSEELLNILKNRFSRNMHRHEVIVWSTVQTKLLSMPERLWSLNEMEETAGEPDVVYPIITNDRNTETFIFCDCSKETPKGRRSVCYDHEAQEARKTHKPKTNAIDMAAAMGVDLLTEEQYFALQKIENFDTKTSSWLKTPTEIREKGGAIFGDYRFGRVFVYHNGADAYFGARGFRGIISV
ncbi:MAG: DUF4256 domain-containing protein [Bacteroidetes bacterium]|jgi:hypothetical protein|nr:DUF4256 domain-containing protein [Bacteroidota bacterium]